MLAWRFSTSLHLKMNAEEAKSDLIYMDNAATSYPKPEEVYVAADRYFRQSANPGRSAHKLALNSAREVFAVREKVAGFLKVQYPERLIFTPGCTYSLNMVLRGLTKTTAGTGQKAILSRGATVLISPLEHNALMRPLKALEAELDLKIVQLPYEPGKIFAVSELRRLLDELRPSLVASVHASNVTGEAIDVGAVAASCHVARTPLLLDAAQTAGLEKTHLIHPGISFWCASAHKGLWGQPGLGLLHVSKEYDLEPLIAGGTGSASEDLQMPFVYPDRLEPGSAAGPAIAALGAGVDFIESVGADVILQHEIRLSDAFISFLNASNNIRVYSPGQNNNSGSIIPRVANVSFSVPGMSADKVVDALDREFSIAARGGLHCAALAHETLGTTKEGLVRISFGYFNSELQVNELARAIHEISQRAAATA
ncbi:MAG: aminotransferase class V-fold PLP-dependent enzyme [Candidatus Melainabacteria bacterium]|nr:aminotransferase class V-fold PLP-dependent enzyme [Candidatus Melainabacteria bacterium]